MFIVDLSKGTAVEQYATKKKSIRIRNYAIFIDDNGAYILTRKEKIYLNTENCVFI